MLHLDFCYPVLKQTCGLQREYINIFLLNRVVPLVRSLRSQGTDHSLSRYDGLEAKQKGLPFVFSELMLICMYADTVIELIVITYN
jgi:hypothetical protein